MGDEGYEDDEWNDSWKGGFWADDQDWNEGYWAPDEPYYKDEHAYFQRTGKVKKAKKGKKGKDDEGKGGKPGVGKSYTWKLPPPGLPGIYL